VTVAIAWLMFASLLSPPLALLLLVAWLFGAHLLLLVPLGVWLLATAWMAINAALRHHRQEKFLEALVHAPFDILEQLARALRLKRPLRLV
jgi:hypothetical protein